LFESVHDPVPSCTTAVQRVVVPLSTVALPLHEGDTVTVKVVGHSLP
jgi:hypothetical protein